MYLPEWIKFKDWQFSVERMRSTCILLVEMKNGTTTFKNCLEVPQKVKHISTLKPSNSTPNSICMWNEDISPQEDRNVPSSLIHESKKRKQSKCILILELVNKLWYICTKLWLGGTEMNFLWSPEGWPYPFSLLPFLRIALSQWPGWGPRESHS